MNEATYGIRLEIYDLATGEIVCYDVDRIDDMSQDGVTIQAGNLGYSLHEEFCAVLYGSGEGD